MRDTKIIIIIPTYNRGWCIENAIKSVLFQEYINWELWIIDDGSTDTTKNIVQNYINDKVKYFYKQNSGKSSTVNYWIDNLISKEGDLLFILDSDDEFLPGIFQDVNQEFLKDNSFVSYHYKAKFPEHITNRYSELIGEDKYKNYIIVDYKKIVSWKSHIWDFHYFINLHKIWGTRFEEKVSIWWFPWIFMFRLNKIWNSKYINKTFLFMDSSRKIDQEKDNITSYSSIYKRASGMIIGYDIILNEHKKEALEIDKNIVSIWYFEQYQWCVIDRNFKKWFQVWKEAIYYGTLKQKIKIVLFWILLLIPKSLLPVILKIYYKLK